MLLEVSTAHGEIEQDEREMLYKVFDFADKEASDVMVPRPDVVGISIEMAPEQALRAVLESPYTRYPVFRESLDEIVGILHVRDLVSALHDSAIAEVELAALLRPAYVVPETKDLAALLAEFRRTNQHMSVVVDEYGSTVGVVTLEDLLEEIVGEIEDEFDLPDESVERVNETTIRIDGTFPIDDFNEEFGTTLEHEDYHTVAGYVFDLIGRAADPGDEVRDGRPADHGARRRGLEDPAARGGVPAGRGRARRRGRRGGVDRTGSTATPGDSPLRHRDFVLFLGVLLASGFAIEMSFVAIGWQVYAVRSNPLDLGLVGLAMFIPLPLLALPAGHLADRFPRRTLLAIAIALEIVIMLGLLAVTRAGATETWPFFLLAFATGVAAALGAPASRALTPSLVPREILVRALAFRSVVFQASVIVGPAIGGLLFALHSELVYGIAALLSVIALAGTLLLRAGRDPAGGSSPDLASVLGGVRLVRRTPVLFGAISLDLFAVLFGGAVALLPVFAKDILEVGPAGLGLLARGAGRRRALRGARDDAVARPAPGREDAPARRRALRRHDRRLRPLADDVAVAARARRRRRRRHGERRPAADDPAARHP